MKRSQSVDIGDAGKVKVRFLGIEAHHERRPVYRVIVKDSSGKVLDQSDDLRLGSGAKPNATAALESALWFLDAAAEHYAYSMRHPDGDEEQSLFSEAATAWAYQNSDEISMAAEELGRDLDVTRGLE